MPERRQILPLARSPRQSMRHPSSVYSKTRDLIDVMAEKKMGYVYTRFSNPTVRVVERKMAELEGTEDACAFSSGMAAISTTILTLVASGDHIVSTRDLYGGTIGLFKKCTAQAWH